MLRGLKRRLDRLWTAYQREKSFRASVREGQRVHEDFIKAIRAGLNRAGIDPATVPAMQFCDEPDPPPPVRPARPPGPGEELREKLLRIVRHCRDQPLDLNHASAMELFAVYCFIPDAPGVSYLAG